MLMGVGPIDPILIFLVMTWACWNYRCYLTISAKSDDGAGCLDAVIVG